MEKEDEMELRQQISDLKGKFHFQVLQNDCLKQQNRQLRHELELIQSLDISTFLEFYKSINILMQLRVTPVALCSKMVSEDWKKLFNCMDILYGDALKTWLTDYDSLSNEDIALCYFCHIGISNVNMATFFGISVQSLFKRRQRLRKKLVRM